MLGDLQVLRRRQRITEPGDVGEIDQQRCGRQRSDDLLAKGVLVADVHPDALAGQAQRRLPRRASGEVGHRDVGHGHEPGKTGRYELAERHQMNLAVVLPAGRAKAQRRIEILLAVGDSDSQQQVAVLAQCQFLQRVEILGGNLVEESRQGGFGQHRELRRVLLCQPVIGAQRIKEPLGSPFHFLRHVSLQQGHRQRLARHLCPAEVTQSVAGDENGCASEQRQRRKAVQPAVRAAGLG
jgi:hypothetical protein